MITQRKSTPAPGDATRARRAWTIVLAPALAAGLLGLGAGVAEAFVPSNGSGGGTAAAGSMQSVTIDATAQDPSVSLLPGTTADATFTVDNPNASVMTLVSVVQNGTISVSGGSGCTLANSGVTFTDQSSLAVSIPASATDYGVDLSGAMSMASTSANGCQNATFMVPITITVHEG